MYIHVFLLNEPLPVGNSSTAVILNSFHSSDKSVVTTFQISHSGHKDNIILGNLINQNPENLYISYDPTNERKYGRT